MIKQAIIPLAGQGTRLLPLTSVFVTTITDVIGFVSFLGVGAYFL